MVVLPKACPLARRCRRRQVKRWRKFAYLSEQPDAKLQLGKFVSGANNCEPEIEEENHYHYRLSAKLFSPARLRLGLNLTQLKRTKSTRAVTHIARECVSFRSRLLFTETVSDSRSSSRLSIGGQADRSQLGSWKLEVGSESARREVKVKLLTYSDSWRAFTVIGKRVVVATQVGLNTMRCDTRRNLILIASDFWLANWPTVMRFKASAAATAAEAKFKVDNLHNPVGLTSWPTANEAGRAKGLKNTIEICRLACKLI